MVTTASDNGWSVERLLHRLREVRPWSPEHRVLPDRSETSLIRSAVLIPLLCEPGQPVRVLLTVRAGGLRRNPSEVSFPGGKAEPEDASLIATALREAHEEVGLRPEDVVSMTALPPYLTNSGFTITPVVGVVSGPVHLHIEADEVQSLIQLPLADLLDESRYTRREVHSEQGTRSWYSLSWEFEGRSHEIWGITAGIARNLRRFLLA